MNSLFSIRHLFIALISILILWILSERYIEQKSQRFQTELQKKRILLAKYHALSKRYDASAQKSAKKRFEKMLHFYGIKAHKRKKSRTLFYDFTLEKKSADTLLNKLLASSLIIHHFEVKKKRNDTLEVTIGVQP